MQESVEKDFGRRRTRRKKFRAKSQSKGNKWRVYTSYFTAACVFSAANILNTPYASAVVGYAERYPEFKEQELEEFHDSLITEETKFQRERSLEIMETVKFQSTQEEQAYDDDIETLKKELLRIPERDRLKLGIDGQYTFDSNIQREPPRQSSSDSVFDVNKFVLVDLGGKKTDLRFEFRAGKQWNIHFPKSDFWTVEERIRYRRKYFKKITNSVQSRLARHSSKTIEIDEKKIRWDSYQNTVFNYAFSRKLSLNTEFNANKRLFRTEAFDQDSQWEVSAAPSLFWNMTPKSRVHLGYRFGASRIRSKTGDTNSHEIALGYFGKATRKSSVSFDISFSHQTPRSEDTSSVNTFKVGVGYIWQMTPKTQMVVQAIRSIQNTTSDPTGTGEDAMVVKSDQYFTNDSINVSLNTRLSRKLNMIFNTGISHFNNETGQSGEQAGETRQFTFPTTLTFNYVFARWLQMRVQYSFAFRTGNEKSDTYRSHALMTGVNMNF